MTVPEMGLVSRLKVYLDLELENVIEYVSQFLPKSMSNTTK
jgi:hypothetical protein